MTSPIAVDPAALAATGAAIGGDAESAAGAVQTLSSALSGAGAQFGHDPAGLLFATSYTPSGKALLDAAASAVNACRRVGFGVQMSASNYGHANAASTVGGGEPPVPAPTDPGAFHAPGMPPPLGGGIAAPVGWSLVESFVGQVWPDGDPGQMRETAAAWRSFATAMTGVAGQVGASGAGLNGHEIPDGGPMVKAVADVQGGLAGLAAQANALAGKVDGFAATVQATQDAVRDLLHQLSPSGVLETIGGIFTGHNPIDKIKQIASEIKTVLNNMKREADASTQLFSQGINELDSLTVQFEHWADKQFVNVFGQEVGGALAANFNNMVDLNEGGLKFVAQTAEGLKQLDPTRFVYDPQGAAKTYEGMAESLATVTNPALLAEKVISDPQGSLDTVKGLVDWEDVEKGRPFAALGYNMAQVGSFFIPGAGEAAPAVDGASAEARVAAQAAGAETRTGAGAAREAGGLAAGATKATDGITSQAGRISETLDNVKVPESTPSAGSSGTTSGGRAPVDPLPAGPSDAPASRGPEATPSAPEAGPTAPEAGATPHESPGPAPVDAPGSGGSADAPTPAEPPAGTVHPESTSPSEPAPRGGESVPNASGAEPHSGGGESLPTAAGAPPPEPPPPSGGGGGIPPHEVSPSEPVHEAPPVSDGAKPGVEGSPEADGHNADANGSGMRPGREPQEGRFDSEGGPDGNSEVKPHGDSGQDAPHDDGQPPNSPDRTDSSSSAGHEPTTTDESADAQDSGDQNLPEGPDHGVPNRPLEAGVDYPFSPQQAFEYLHDPSAELQRLADGHVPPTVLEGYDPLANRSLDEFKHEFTVQRDDGSLRWDWENQAPNNGFAGEPVSTDAIPKGQQLDRIGPDTGAFMAQQGAPLGERGMAPGAGAQYHTYEGTGVEVPPGTDWVVQYGPAKPAFGQPGGANQWVVIDLSTGDAVPARDLVVAGMLRDTTPLEWYPKEGVRK
jgi:hypothetical protein